MIFIHIWNFLKGYVMIRVEGLKIERFINLLVVNDIYVWDIEKIDFTTIRLKMNHNDVMGLREIARRTESSIHIEKKAGLPFLLLGLKRRKVMLAVTAVLLVGVYALTSRVWMVEITGLKTMDQTMVMNKLNEIGLKEGISKRAVDQRYLESKLLVEVPDLSYAAVRVRGTKVIVDCVERRKEPEIISDEEPCDIVADKDGVIKSMNILNGDALVTLDETVTKGQVLVTGRIVREKTEDRLVHAMAEITARTWYEKADIVPLVQKDFLKTGRHKTYFRLKFLENDLQKEKKPPYAEYNKIVGEKNLFAFGDFVLPIQVERTEYVELQSIEKKVTVEEAKKQCLARLRAAVQIEIGEAGKIVNEKVDYVVSKDQVQGKLLVEVVEPIGVNGPVSEKTVQPKAEEEAAN